MRSPALHDEDHERDEAHAAADHLRGTQRRAGNEQGRGAQRLEQEADEAVPDKVQKRRLTVVLPFSLPRPYGKENKAHEIPERFIQEQRGFLFGLYAGNYDISHIFIDNLFKITGGECNQAADDFLNELERFSNATGVKFTISVSGDPALATDGMQKYL